MTASISLGRVGGIPIGLHYSWFVIAALITFSLWNHFHSTQPDWSSAVIWTTTIDTAVLFFVSLLAHELAHALTARSRQLPVRSITLFALGGVARMDKDANKASTELLVAVMGPVTSVVIGVTCIVIARAMGWSPDGGSSGVVAAILGWLGSINLLLAGFNLVPAFPLDGGRMLRGGLWALYGSVERATRHASLIGQMAAVGFIVLGLLSFFTMGGGIAGLWLALIGWFLLSAAQGEYAQVTIREALQEVRVADVMAHDCVTVEATSDVQHVVDDVLLRTGRRCVIVEEDGAILGLLTPKDLRHVDRHRWRDVVVREVMRPLDRLRTVTPDTPLSDAFAAMAQADVHQLPVMARGRLEGVVDRGHILQLLKSRAELAR